MKKLFVCVFCVFIWVLFLMPVNMAAATELVYTPVNPSFGGCPLNGQYLLNQATLQNKFKEDRPSKLPKTPLEKFTQQLEYSIFSGIANEIVHGVFGEQALQPGQYTFGNYSVDVSTDVDGITVVITDITTDNTTTIQVPYY
ncbi:MAG: curli assembly protein CsgF [bacterium]